jgi:hypothetical protein
MDIGAALVSDRQAAKPVELRDGAFDDPSADAQTTAVWHAASREDEDNAACPEPVAVGLGIVGAVAQERAGLAARAAPAAADRRERVDHRVQVGDVVDIGCGHLCDKRDAARVRDEDGAWFFPPHSACWRSRRTAYCGRLSVIRVMGRRGIW